MPSRRGKRNLTNYSQLEARQLPYGIANVKNQKVTLDLSECWPHWAPNNCRSSSTLLTRSQLKYGCKAWKLEPLSQGIYGGTSKEHGAEWKIAILVSNVRILHNWSGIGQNGANYGADN